jgi:hypothetical protein
MSKTPRLLVGVTIAAFAWVVLIFLSVARGRPLSWFSVSYNLPITLAFSGLLAHGVLSAFGLGSRLAIHAYGPIALVWCAGGVVLFLRLVTQSIDVSGHMSWAILMAVQCTVERLPIWFTALVWLIAAHVLLLKLFVLGGQSGQNGILAGGVLGATLWLVTRRYWGSLGYNGVSG